MPHRFRAERTVGPALGDADFRVPSRTACARRSEPAPWCAFPGQKCSGFVHRLADGSWDTSHKDAVDAVDPLEAFHRRHPMSGPSRTRLDAGDVQRYRQPSARCSTSRQASVRSAEGRAKDPWPARRRPRFAAPAASRCSSCTAWRTQTFIERYPKVGGPATHLLRSGRPAVVLGVVVTLERRHPEGDGLAGLRRQCQLVGHLPARAAPHELAQQVEQRRLCDRAKPSAIHLRTRLNHTRLPLSFFHASARNVLRQPRGPRRAAALWYSRNVS